MFVGSLKAWFVTGMVRDWYVIDVLFIGSLKAWFVTERSEAGSCRAFTLKIYV